MDSVDGLFSRLWKLSIYRNPLLTTCAVQSVCDYLGSGKWAEVFDNAPGCVDTTEITTDCQSIGIEEKEVDNLIILFPNPFSGGDLNLQLGNQFQGTLKISLSDSKGRQILKRELDYSEQIHLSIPVLEPGLYFIKVQDNNDKIVIQKLLTN